MNWNKNNVQNQENCMLQAVKQLDALVKLEDAFNSSVKINVLGLHFLPCQSDKHFVEHGSSCPRIVRQTQIFLSEVLYIFINATV